MPKAFKEAIKKGARVRTKKIGSDKYIHIAYLDGESYQGEVKTKKTNPPGTKKRKGARK